MEEKNKQPDIATEAPKNTGLPSIPINRLLQDQIIFRRDNGSSITVNINGIDYKLATVAPNSSASASVSPSSSISPSVSPS